MDPKKRELAERVSIMYYEKNKNQNEIAETMEISRSYVSQLLSFARENGIVKININIDDFNLRMIRKEIEFKEKFPQLKQIYIMSSESDEFTEINLGKFAAPYIAEMINESNIIGVNLGLSVEKAINNLENQNLINTNCKKVVQIMGGFNNNIAAAHPNELVSKLGSILNCECYYLNCPGVVEQPELRKVLLKERSIESVINMWNNIDLAIMGVGVASSRSKLFKLFNEDMVDQIEKSGACGDLSINFFDDNGNWTPMLENNKISIPVKQLKKVKRKVIICNGDYKKRAIIGALKSGLVDVLITDSITVESIENSIENRE